MDIIVNNIIALNRNNSVSNSFFNSSNERDLISILSCIVITYVSCLYFSYHTSYMMSVLTLMLSISLFSAKKCKKEAIRCMYTRKKLQVSAFCCFTVQLFIQIRVQAFTFQRIIFQKPFQIILIFLSGNGTGTDVYNKFKKLQIK